MLRSGNRCYGGIVVDVPRPLANMQDVKKNLEKIEKDRLYLDATKARGQAVCG